MINYRQNKKEILMLYTPNEIVDLYLKQCIVSDKQKEEIERLNNIISKAIEYIDRHSYSNISNSYDVLYNGQIEELLEILKGEDNV